ncbi:MAG: DUF177 domain-containing protein [Candidatus Kapaibacterium sp.]|jgi:uncharacterized metal-binding protein YceD (DUF177 family)|nr:DUF177 domain-containing protein [Candidatus Kapabacteria bacterium]
MIKIDISGMADGEYEFDISTPIGKIECVFDEFFGNVGVKVRVIRLGTRYNLKTHAEAIARLECDRSLRIYEEKIATDFELSYRADTKLYLESGSHGENDKEIIIREDFKYIDISQEVMEHLALQLPMKRLAPEFRDKDIEEIFPEIRIAGNNDGAEPIDDRWSKLKDLKFN